MLASVVLGLLVASAPVHPSVSFAPAPGWVEAVAEPSLDHLPKNEVSDGLHLLVFDDQVKVGATVERYHRVIRHVLTAEGAERGAEVRFGFDPAFEKLVVHGIWIHRGGQRIDALRADAVKILADEPEQARRMYDGRLTALVHVEDVRAGDTIEHASTVVGDNPVFDGIFTDETYLAGPSPVGLIRYRLSWPGARPLSYRTHGIELPPRITERGAEREYVWERRDVARVPFETSVPGWHVVYPFVQLTEFESWADVERWGTKTFGGVDATPSPALEAEVARWAAETPSPEARLLRATRFVQRDVRYLAVLLGRGAYEPNPPSLVFERRFGDCKDKSLLLSWMLGRLGIEAHPALVHTNDRRGLDAMLPSATVFDHAIVAAKLDGRTIWIDATDSTDRGGVDELSPIVFERALVLGTKAGALTTIPSSPVAGGVDVEETHHVESYDKPVKLEVVTKYSGFKANGQRSALTTLSIDELAKNVLDYYARQDPKIRAEGPPVVEDDETNNVVTIRERYVIDDYWDGVRRDYYADAVALVLREPAFRDRKAPLAITHPEHVRHRIIVRLPEPWEIEDSVNHVDGEAFRVTEKVRYSAKRLELEYTYDSKVDHLPAASVEGHVRDVKRARDQLGYWIAYRMVGAKKAERNTALGLLAFFAVLFGGLVGFVRVRDHLRDRPARARKQRFLANSRHAEGSAPETPLTAKSADDAKGAAASRRCGRCRTAGPHTLGDGDDVVYGERRLFVVRTTCRSCGETSRTYFELERAG